MGCHCTKDHTKCATLVYENNNRLFCCASVREFEPNILIKGVHPTNFEKKTVRQKVDFFLTKKGTHIVNLKKVKTDSCHRTTFYSIFNMSSSRKPEVYTKDLPKITIIK